MLLLMREERQRKVRLCGVFVVKSKISLSTVFLFFLSRLFAFFFVFSLAKKRLLVFAAFEFFRTTTTTHM